MRVLVGVPLRVPLRIPLKISLPLEIPVRFYGKVGKEMLQESCIDGEQHEEPRIAKANNTRQKQLGRKCCDAQRPDLHVMVCDSIPVHRNPEP